MHSHPSPTLSSLSPLVKVLMSYIVRQQRRDRAGSPLAGPGVSSHRMAPAFLLWDRSAGASSSRQETFSCFFFSINPAYELPRALSWAASGFCVAHVLFIEILLLLRLLVLKEAANVSQCQPCGGWVIPSFSPGILAKFVLLIYADRLNVSFEGTKLLLSPSSGPEATKPHH